MESNRRIAARVAEEQTTYVAPEAMHICILEFKLALVRYFIGLKPLKSIKPYIDAMSNLSNGMQKEYRQEIRKVFSDFYILDKDFSRLRMVIFKYTKEKHPCKILVRETSLLYKQNRVDLAWREQMHNYYRLVADCTSLLVSGAWLREDGKEVGNEVISIAVTIANGVTTHAASLHLGKPNTKPLDDAYEQATALYKYSKITHRSLQEIIVDALNCIAKALPVLKPILRYFDNLDGVNVRQSAKSSIKRLGKITQSNS